MEHTSRLWRVTLVGLLLVACSGCVTVQPDVVVQEDDSSVFESVTTNSEWGTSSVQASVTLTSSATTSQGVTQINVITRDGKSFYTTTVDSGQTNVSLPVPTGQASTLVAVNTVNGTVVGMQNVTVTGTRYP
ncbi:hypothetical protein SAMN04487950_2744 [Halogranum rubrum]|uniref:Uncharacterized protein n=1 Tax=Halogranum rubrum TaxID=553466 RepID=A0A1I4FEH9_9EURY|nr:hypothetical protein [Halogranum rubrum]SFL15216.1 hypothetical protein SAMN04487950_2744 [Halogranum rubrum]